MSGESSYWSRSPGSDMQDNSSPFNDSFDPKNPARLAQAALPTRSKTDLKYWQKRIFKPGYCRDNGEKAQSANYAVEIRFRGRRVKWSLYTPNKEAAAARAKELYLFVQANGWEAAFARYRPKEALPSGARRDVSVREFLCEVDRLRLFSASTLRDYREAFRRIVSDVAGIPRSRSKFDRFGGGYQRWIEAVGVVKLCEITPQKVAQWKRDFLCAAKPDPISQRSARVSANSYLRRSKCLFSRSIIKEFALSLPDPLPFSGVEFEKRPSLKYQSCFDIGELIAKAREELAGKGEIELFKIFLLAAFAGLRRREIDSLPWSAFRWDQGVLRIEPTLYFRPKSEDSVADIPLDPEVCALFRGYYALCPSGSQFVIASDGVPSLDATYPRYRCLGLFKKLYGWLRAHGVKAIRPLHTLRKEFGSAINRAHGIHAASLALRHSSIAITSAVYVDSRVRITSGLGALLIGPGEKEGSNVLPLPRAARSAAL